MSAESENQSPQRRTFSQAIELAKELAKSGNQTPVAFVNDPLFESVGGKGAVYWDPAAQNGKGAAILVSSDQQAKNKVAPLPIPSSKFSGND